MYTIIHNNNQEYTETSRTSRSVVQLKTGHYTQRNRLFLAAILATVLCVLSAGPIRAVMAI